MMAGMRRRIAYSIGWLAATVAAIALAWLGVRSVLVTSVFAAPMTIAAPAVPVTTAPAPPATATASASPRASAAAAPSASATADEHVYSTPGGTAVLKVTATTVSVLSSSPNDDFTAQVSNGTDWLRVDFLTGNGAHGWSVVASWYLHAPTIQVVSF
jgi:hypothetical protein